MLLHLKISKLQIGQYNVLDAIKKKERNFRQSSNLAATHSLSQAKAYGNKKCMHDGLSCEYHLLANQACQKSMI